MKKALPHIIVGLFLGTIIPIMLEWIYLPKGQNLIDLKQSIRECEKDLPRTETCELIAVPKK